MPVSYQHLSMVEMHTTLKNRDKRIVQLQQQFERLRGRWETERKQRRRCETRLAKLTENQMDEDVSSKDASLGIVFCKPGSRRLTTRSMIITGIRRNMSNIACCDFGVTVLEDNLGRYKVARCEIMASIRLQAASREFYNTMAQEVLARKSEFSVGVHASSCDATGGNIVKNKKFSNCFVDSTFYFDDCIDFDCRNPHLSLEDLPRQRRCCDLLEQTGSTAKDTQILARHFSSVGCPTWSYISPHDKHLNLVLYCADKGPDQERTANVFPYQVQCNNTMFMAIHCFDHSSHLIERKSLQIVDIHLKSWCKGWKYHSTNTKMCYVWRAGRMKMWECLLELSGPKVAQHAMLFPFVQCCQMGRLACIRRQGVDDWCLSTCGSIQFIHGTQVWRRKTVEYDRI